MYTPLTTMLYFLDDMYQQTQQGVLNRTKSRVAFRVLGEFASIIIKWKVKGTKSPFYSALFAANTTHLGGTKYKLYILDLVLNV